MVTRLLTLGNLGSRYAWRCSRPPICCQLRPRLPLSADARTGLLVRHKQSSPSEATVKKGSDSAKDAETDAHLAGSYWQRHGPAIPTSRLDQKRAFEDYLLTPADLAGLNQEVRQRSPFRGVKSPLITYDKVDVERRAIEVWGSMKRIEDEKQRREEEALDQAPTWWNIFTWGRRSPHNVANLFPQKLDDARVIQLEKTKRVVWYAIGANTLVMLGKFAACYATGSASLMSEGIHSLADVANQTLLLVGIQRSVRAPDKEHPYGYLNERYLWALVSGVGIFFVGCGVSVYHGVMALRHPEAVQSLHIAISLLALSGILEGGSLWVAWKQVKLNAKAANMTLRQYLHNGSDPNDVAVLVEDGVAVLGVGVAGACVTASWYLDSPVYDACGSIVIGAMLGMCAMFLIKRNMDALVGKSISPTRLRQIVNHLDTDPVVMSTHDVKATQMGADSVRFKAEIDVDGRAVAQRYVATVTAQALLEEAKAIQAEKDVEAFMLKHGAGVVNLLGEEVDRIEQKIQEFAPEVRHVDLEIL